MARGSGLELHIKHLNLRVIGPGWEFNAQKLQLQFLRKLFCRWPTRNVGGSRAAPKVRQGIVKLDGRRAPCRNPTPAPLENVPDRIANPIRRSFRKFPGLYFRRYVATIAIMVGPDSCQYLGYQHEILQRPGDTGRWDLAS